MISRAWLAASLSAFLFITGGCGSDKAPTRVGVVVAVDSLGGGGGDYLAQAGIRQLDKELSTEVYREDCPGTDLSQAVAAGASRGAEVALVVGRGEMTLDLSGLDPRVPVVALDTVLCDGSGRLLGEEDGVTQVRYRVEEGAYLAGVLAAGVTTTRGLSGVNSDAVVAFIGCKGAAQPEAWRLGFEKGVEAVNPNCAVAEYEVPSSADVDNTRASVEAALKLKADVFFCAPGAFSREVLALAGARGFLVIVSDAAEDAADPEALLARTVLRDDLALFRAARSYLDGELEEGELEWGREENVIDFSVAPAHYSLLPSSLLQTLQQPVPRQLLPQQ
jgi:basic membrane protein A